MTHKSACYFVRPDPGGAKVMPLIQNSYIFMFTVVLYLCSTVNTIFYIYVQL